MNDMRRNDYLRRRRDRRMEQDYARGRSRDMRRGRRGRDYEMYRDSRGYSDYRRGSDYAMDRRDYYPEHIYRDYNADPREPYEPMATRGDEHYGQPPRMARFEMHGVGGMHPYGDYSSDDVDKEYEKDLHHWIEKLTPKNRFKLISKEQVLQQAKNMGVKFEEYDEHEFYAIYLMHVTDYPTISNEYNMYIRMAKDWLEDDDLPISPSEKVCRYLYSIVLGED